MFEYMNNGVEKTSGDQLSEKAFRWVKANRSIIVNRFATPKEFQSDSYPTSVFMAGSPGAGKTEISIRLVSRFKNKPVLIDADEIRKICPGYNGQNAHLFQRAATKGVHELYTYALKHNYNLILDGTFAYYNVRKNLDRSLNKERRVEIFFIYNDLLQAWEFVKEREANERRKVTKDIFIRSYFDSLENIRKEKEYYGSSLQLNVVIKNLDSDEDIVALDVDSVDEFDLSPYTESELYKLLI